MQSFRYFPSNIEVIKWLGAYYVDTQFCEKAIQYFERATLIQYVTTVIVLKKKIA